MGTKETPCEAQACAVCRWASFCRSYASAAAPALLLAKARVSCRWCAVMAKSSAAGPPANAGRKISAGRRRADWVSSGDWGSKARDAPFRVSSQLSQPKHGPHLGQRSAAVLVLHQRHKHQRDGRDGQECHRNGGTRHRWEHQEHPAAHEAQPQNLPFPCGWDPMARQLGSPGPQTGFGPKGGPLSGASAGKLLFPASSIQTSGKGMLVESKSFFQTELAATVQLRVQTAQGIKGPRRSEHLHRREPTVEFSTSTQARTQRRQICGWGMLHSGAQT